MPGNTRDDIPISIDESRGIIISPGYAIEALRRIELFPAISYSCLSLSNSLSISESLIIDYRNQVSALNNLRLADASKRKSDSAEELRRTLIIGGSCLGVGILLGAIGILVIKK